MVHRRDEELASYIEELTERHLMPTGRTDKNFAAPVIGKEPRESRLTSFVGRKDTRSSQPAGSPRAFANQRKPPCLPLLPGLYRDVHLAMIPYEDSMSRTTVPAQLALAGCSRLLHGHKASVSMLARSCA